ncbi:unnamed protein product [Sphenostylis stenocarpa]|uniref:UDP-glycosyltransferase n=1 Tax=Sphenostylis stenocarpa TaxID=92480 RepID=A0AA86RZK5_9FABA|nr:unnamed protein product [Sphenostylis stenocarpa]
MKESKKGFIIWNWAPQLLILNHPAIGGIVTHCGWNSILESLSAGLPMITWPMFAEQFYNERLLVDVLKVGVPVGVKENKFWASKDMAHVVGREEIAKAVVQLMEKEEGRETRRRARKLCDASKKTIEKGGDSYNNLMQLIDDLKSLKISKAHSRSSTLYCGYRVCQLLACDNIKNDVTDDSGFAKDETTCEIQKEEN